MKSNPVLALLADDLPSVSAGSILGLMLFAVVLIVVAAVMAISAKRLALQSALLTWFIWLSVGLIMQPWTFFTHQSSMIPVDPYWAPCWQIAAIVWVLSLLLGFVLLIAIYKGSKSRRRRRRRSSSSGGSSRRNDESRQRSDSRKSRGDSESRRREDASRPKGDDEEYEEYDDDSYEV